MTKALLNRLSLKAPRVCVANSGRKRRALIRANSVFMLPRDGCRPCRPVCKACLLCSASLLLNRPPVAGQMEEDRGGEDDRVEAVEHAAVSGDHPAPILHAAIARSGMTRWLVRSRSENSPS